MLDISDLLDEVTYKAVKSSGAGGQHVNKTATKVELYFNIADSSILEPHQKERLYKALQNRLTKTQVLILQCGESRSQLKNKTLVTQRFIALIKAGLKAPKKRKPTKIPKAVKIKRLKKKRQHAEKKAHRKPPEI